MCRYPLTLARVKGIKLTKKINFSVLALLLFVTGTMALASLAFWQHQRMLGKQALAQTLALQQHLPALTILPDTWQDDSAFRKVELAGQFLAGTTTLLQHQKHQDEPVWRVITPMQIGDKIVLVDRGITTIPNNRLNPPLSSYAPTPLTQKVVGILRPMPHFKSWLPSPVFNTSNFLRLRLDTSNWPNVGNNSLESAYYIQAQQVQPPHPVIMPVLDDASALPASRHRGYRNTWLTLLALQLIWGIYVFRKIVHKT